MLGIFDYHSWIFIFISMVAIYGFLWVIGACYGLDYHYQEIPLCPIRIRLPEYVPYLSNTMCTLKMPLLMPRGFSANLVLLLWYFMGGVCLWAFEDNILALMFKQVFEDPVDTAQQVKDRGLIPFVRWFSGGLVGLLARSDDEVYQYLASKAVIPKDSTEYHDLMQFGVQGNETHVLLGPDIVSFVDTSQFGLYHVSKEVLAGYLPYVGWIENKHFQFSEQLAKHIAIYQQAGLTHTAVGVSDPLPPPPDFQQIDWYHLALPAMIHCMCCVIALLVFLLQSARAVCGRRVAPTRDTADREDTEDTDRAATGQEGDSSEEDAAAGNTNDYDEISTII